MTTLGVTFTVGLGSFIGLQLAIPNPTVGAVVLFPLINSFFACLVFLDGKMLVDYLRLTRS